VRGEIEWLLALRCADGSRAFSSADEAHEARVGNVGSGGRCGRVVDLYEVACPERDYKIYMDLYHCTPSERER
jgi:hypothetical protein